MERDFMLIHGYILTPDGTIRDILEERLEYAVELDLDFPVRNIIVAGKHGKEDEEYVKRTGRTEARAMYDRLQEKGINPARIHLEPEGTNTWDCTKNAYDRLIKPMGWKSGVVISTAEHLPRICYQAMQIFDVALFGNTLFGGPSVKDSAQRASFLEWEAKSVQAYTLPSLLAYAAKLRANTSQPTS